MAERNLKGDVNVEFNEASSRQGLDSGESVKTLFGKVRKWLSDLKPVAFSGSYSDLSNKPTIPTVNNGTLTIQQNGTTKATFTANQAGNTTANLTDTTYSAGDTMTLDNTTFDIGKRWTAVSKGQTWSRLFYSVRKYASIGSSGILSISATRYNVAIQATFLIISAAASIDKSVQIIEIASNNFFSVDLGAIRVRAVTGGAGYYYFEIYDTANGIAVGTEQTWNCRYIPLLESTLTLYTSFTDGTTIPASWVAVNDFTTDLGSNAVAIKNITRSGNTFTATRQDGSTFTFSGVDFGTTAGTVCEGNDARVVNAIQTISVNGVNQPAVDNNVNIETGDAFGVDMYDNTLPIDITARGDNLEDWIIYGNANGVGEYDAESGGYVLPIVTKQRTVNLYNKDTKTNGYRVTWAAGALVSWQNGQISDYIPIEQSNYRCTINVFVLGYDSNKTYLGALTSNGFVKDSPSLTINSFTINDSNAKYIRLLSFAYPETAAYSFPDDLILCKGDTIPSTFIPYEYTKTSTIYLGTSPLTEGQSLNKSQATTKDIPTFNGDCIIDTSLSNKPRMEIIPTASAINIINRLKELTQQALIKEDDNAGGYDITLDKPFTLRYSFYAISVNRYGITLDQGGNIVSIKSDGIYFNGNKVGP